MFLFSYDQRSCTYHTNSGIKKILGSDINDSIFIMSRIINDLNKSNATKLAKLATKYYGPQVRSLLGLIFENTGSKDIESSLYENLARKLKKTLNPVTRYKLNINSKIWANAKNWSIH